MSKSFQATVHVFLIAQNSENDPSNIPIRTNDLLIIILLSLPQDQGISVGRLPLDGENLHHFLTQMMHQNVP